MSTIRSTCRPPASSFGCSRCCSRSLLCKTFLSKVQRQPARPQGRGLGHPLCDNGLGLDLLSKGSISEPFHRDSSYKTLPHHYPSQGTVLVYRDRVCTPGNKRVFVPSTHNYPCTGIQTDQTLHRDGKAGPCRKVLLFPAGSTGPMV